MKTSVIVGLGICAICVNSSINPDDSASKINIINGVAKKSNTQEQWEDEKAKAEFYRLRNQKFNLRSEQAQLPVGPTQKIPLIPLTSNALPFVVRPNSLTPSQTISRTESNHNQQTLVPQAKVASNEQILDSVNNQVQQTPNSISNKQNWNQEVKNNNFGNDHVQKSEWENLQTISNSKTLEPTSNQNQEFYIQNSKRATNIQARSNSVSSSSQSSAELSNDQSTLEQSTSTVSAGVSLTQNSVEPNVKPILVAEEPTTTYVEIRPVETNAKSTLTLNANPSSRPTGRLISTRIYRTRAPVQSKPQSSSIINVVKKSESDNKTKDNSSKPIVENLSSQSNSQGVSSQSNTQSDSLENTAQATPFLIVSSQSTVVSNKPDTSSQNSTPSVEPIKFVQNKKEIQEIKEQVLEPQAKPKRQQQSILESGNSRNWMSLQNSNRNSGSAQEARQKILNEIRLREQNKADLSMRQFHKS